MNFYLDLYNNFLDRRGVLFFLEVVRVFLSGELISLFS